MSYSMLLFIKLQNVLLPLVRNLLIILFIIFLILLVFYIYSIFFHYILEHFFKIKFVSCKNLVSKLNSEDNFYEYFVTKLKNSKIFYKYIVDIYSNCDEGCARDKIRQLYKDLGYFALDIKSLKSKFWWKVVEAIERLGILEFKEAEEFILPFIFNNVTEIKLAALKSLILLKSEKFYEMLPNFFEETNRWLYRYIVNKLYLKNISIKYLRPLIFSPNRDFRKAAAILLGQEGNNEVVGMLEILSKDEVKDVRREAIISLGKTKLERVIEILKDRSSDFQPEIRKAVVIALKNFNNNETLNLLERFVLDNDFEVMLEAFYILKSFGIGGQKIIKKYCSKNSIGEKFLDEKFDTGVCNLL